MNKGVRVVALLVSTLCARAESARAAVFDLYGFEGRGTALGNAMTAAADDYTATYYNPALLPYAKRVRAGISYQFTKPVLSIERYKLDSTIANAEAPSYGGLSLGFMFPLGHKIGDRFALGLAIYLPTTSIIRIQSITPTTPHWYLFTSYPDKIQVLVGLACRIVDQISLGFGFHTLAEAPGSARVSVDVVNRLITQNDIDLKISANTAFTAGLASVVFDDPEKGKLKLGLSYRASLELDFRLPVSLTLEGIGAVDLDVRGIVHYTPHQINFGASYDLPSRRLRFSADLTLALWKYAPDPSIKFGVNLSGDLVAKLGLQDLLNLSTTDAPVGAYNVLVPRLGVEFDLNKIVQLRAGYFFRATMIPRQTAPQSNYMDANAHVVSFGAGFTFPDPLEAKERPVSIDLGFQFTIMPRRSATKTDPGDPVGDLAAAGFIFNFVAGLRHDF
jgi:long-chain fatty acid transport protein